MRAHVLAQSGQAFQAQQDPLLFAFGTVGGRRARRSPRRTSLITPELAPIMRPVADVDVIGHADLAGHDDVVPGRGRAGDADLADEQVVPADLAVVADLHQVVDLGAAPMRVAWKVPRSMVVPAPISTSSPISTVPSCGTFCVLGRSGSGSRTRRRRSRRWRGR